MKKIFGLIATLILMMGCDDGEMSFNTFNFSDGAPSMCSNSNIYYKINGTEVLILNLSGDNLTNVPTPEDANQNDIPREIEIGATNTITYRNYDGTPTAGSICSFPAPASPGVLEEWSGEGTIQVITDVVRSSNNIITGYSHKIILKDVSFSKNGETTRIVDNEFGSIIVPVGFTFDFDEEGQDEPEVEPCDENSLIFKRNSSEALILNLDPSQFPTVADTTVTLDIADLTDEGVIFLVYGGTITDDHICDVISPISPVITERWEATSGNIVIKAVEVSGGSGTLEYQIHFNTMVFLKVSDGSGQTFTISDLVNLNGSQEYYFGVYTPN